MTGKGQERVSAGGGAAGRRHELAARAAAETALEAAVAAGAEAADAWAERRRSRRVVVWREAVEELGEAVSCGVGVRAFVDGRWGFAYASGFASDELAEAARAAVALARIADRETGAGLPDHCGQAEVPDLADERLLAASSDHCVELARACERAARAQRAVTDVEQVVYQDAWLEVALANSASFAGAFTASSAWMYCTAFAGEVGERMSGFGLDIARAPHGLDPERTGREAGERAALLAGATKPPSRRCAVLFDAFAAAALVAAVGEMLSAEQVERGRSPFADKLGAEVASSSLTIADDATLPDGPASAPFDGEGSPTGRTELIAGGRLLTFVHDVRTARRAGTNTTANALRSSYRTPPVVGVSNLVVAGEQVPFAQLLATLGDGFYITDLSGLHSGVNPVSGTFSVGASGVVVRGGELAEPAREMTVAGSLTDLLRDVQALGDDRRWVPLAGSVSTPSLLVDGITVSGR